MANARMPEAFFELAAHHLPGRTHQIPPPLLGEGCF